MSPRLASVVGRSTRPAAVEHLIEVRFRPRALGGIPAPSVGWAELAGVS